MEIPVSEQMRRLKTKIKKFRDMLSRPSFIDDDFEEKESENSFVFSNFLLEERNEEKEKHKAYKNDISPALFNRLTQNKLSSSKYSENCQIYSTNPINKIKSNSRGYHYSNYSKNTRSIPKKPILFVKKFSDSSSDYSDYSETDEYSEDSLYDDKEEEESSEDSESFSLISKTLKKKATQKKEKRAIKKLSEVNLSESLSDDEQNGSLVSKLIKKATTKESSSSSLINASDDIIVVQKPIYDESNNQKTEKNYDSLLYKISKQKFDTSDENDENFSLDKTEIKKSIAYEEEEDDYQEELAPLLMHARKLRNNSSSEF